MTTTARGWKTDGLPVVGDDENLWSPKEAAFLLIDPDDEHPLDVAALRRYINRSKLTPVGRRRTTRNGQPGRYSRVYRAADLIALYEDLRRNQAA